MQRETYWMNPKFGMPIKWTDQRTNPRGQPRKDDVAELVALKAQRD